MDLNQIETAEQLEEAAEKLKAFSGKRSAKVRADKKDVYKRQEDRRSCGTI